MSLSSNRSGRAQPEDWRLDRLEDKGQSWKTRDYGRWQRIAQRS